MSRHTVAFNVRLPSYTAEQVERLCATYGLTQVQLVVLAIDRLASALTPTKSEAAPDPSAPAAQ